MTDALIRAKVIDVLRRVTTIPRHLGELEQFADEIVDVFERKLASRDRRIVRLVAALDYARQQGVEFLGDDAQLSAQEK